MAEISTPQEAQSWYQILTDFPSYWSNFQKNFQALLAQSNYITSKHPELQAEYDRLVREGSENYQKLYEINGSLQSIKSGWDTFTGWLTGGFSGLSIAPIIVGISAASAGAVFYAVATWLADTSKFAQRVEEAKRLEAQGMKPAEVTTTLEKRYGSPDSGSVTLFGFPIKYVIIGAGLLFIAPTVIDLIKKRRG